tara:strand:+ start:679 stop:813 length:135 start_codon:yes stop_codon:yes gene_type:complete
MVILGESYDYFDENVTSYFSNKARELGVPMGFELDVHAEGLEFN